MIICLVCYFSKKFTPIWLFLCQEFLVVEQCKSDARVPPIKEDGLAFCCCCCCAVSGSVAARRGGVSLCSNVV